MFTVETIKERLQSFGYEVREEDMFSLTFCMEKIQTSIKTNINHVEIPKELESIAVDRTVGEFLLAKKTFAPKELSNFDLDYAVKQIQAGDTNTVFAVGEGTLTPEQRLDAFLQYLLSYGSKEFHTFRRIQW